MIIHRPLFHLSPSLLVELSQQDDDDDDDVARRVEKRHATKEIKSSRAAFFFTRKNSRRSKDRELEKHGSIELLPLPLPSLSPSVIDTDQSILDAS